MTIPQALQLGLQHHNAGRLAEAEGIYRQILAAQPNHPGALHLLGILANQAGRHEMAEDLIRRAIAANPADSNYHLALGNALLSQGRLDEAAAAYRGAIQVKPDFAMVHSNLGAALKAKGRFDEAIASYRSAVGIAPNSADFHNNLAVALQETGKSIESVDACRAALQINPKHAPALYNLGIALQSQCRLDEAIQTYRRAIQIRPNHALTFNNLGAALRDQGHLDEAMAMYRRALELNPDLPETYNNLGIALKDLGQLDEAISASRRAVTLRPGYPEAHNTLGVAYSAQDQIDEATTAFRRALELRVDWPAAHSNLGTALKDLGRFDEAIAAFRRALSSGHKDPRLHSNLVFTLHFHPGYSDAAIITERELWNRHFGEPLKPMILPHANDRTPERRLRIGYVSPDFRDHVVGRNLIPLFERHDLRNFEILCYAQVERSDAVTERIRGRVHHWRNTVNVTDEALAGMIRQDGVDILVDLSQHTANNRLPTFARKPAPVQVSFAGYPDSSGLEAIEYRISDPYLEAGRAAAADGPTGKEHVCLIDSFWCYDPCENAPEAKRLPASENGNVTFGCMNNYCKFNERVLSLWAQVLRKVTGSRLVLMSRSGNSRQRILEMLDREGIDRGRMEFVEHLPLRKYLETYHRVDIVLDTVPYNGHTTSLDALWMGVPVVSLAERSPVSRAGLSHLTNLGLPELIAHSEEDYVRISAELAADLPRLAKLRSTLRHRMENSVLMDAPRFAQNIETAYRIMWRRWCATP